MLNRELHDEYWCNHGFISREMSRECRSREEGKTRRCVMKKKVIVSRDNDHNNGSRPQQFNPAGNRTFLNPSTHYNPQPHHHHPSNSKPLNPQPSTITLLPISRSTSTDSSTTSPSLITPSMTPIDATTCTRVATSTSTVPSAMSTMTSVTAVMLGVLVLVVFVEIGHINIVVDCVGGRRTRW
ncbi:hypothetical protein GE21DRAFT_71 [Neurospora crassa]|uniref:Uncharacterized protein n=1 Tax=Neurospora crassa (strain ATCC 24698 / 74-OR23-1A / CBS 708.71 / DSM 1257 / FGSC 987) TaxID=367110 RepID=Q7SGI5_NEUCR|nr:hypothetical protein NCU08099 [Neurospora crassa OR74A]EAA35994.1 hypothetical protein NCU08099 [Neurospora crassa OR74A]KHE84525.1 hypothetical protein GE21DRAFT_71 [Neurospora crassa]|eukprot:XP_965230.1 hypothetical protein NCU08099 [Neurospora crassa OR74A]